MKLQIVNVKPWKAWDNETKKAGDRLGTTYTVIRFKARGPVLVDVKAPGEEIVTTDYIRQQYIDCHPVWADFEGYEEDAYAKDNNVYYTAVAKSVALDPAVLDFD